MFPRSENIDKRMYILALDPIRTDLSDHTSDDGPVELNDLDTESEYNAMQKHNTQYRNSSHFAALVVIAKKCATNLVYSNHQDMCSYYRIDAVYIRNPDIWNPDIRNPDIRNPDYQLLTLHYPAMLHYPVSMLDC